MPWVGRGRCRRELLDSINRLRKKIFIDGIYLILFFALSRLDRVRSDHVAPPPRVFASVVLHPFKVTAYFFPLIFCQSIRRSVQGDNAPPHVPPWSRALPETPSNVDTDFYLIVACFN